MFQQIASRLRKPPQSAIDANTPRSWQEAEIVFSSVYPQGKSTLHLMETLCGWTAQHGNTGLLRLLIAPSRSPVPD